MKIIISKRIMCCILLIVYSQTTLCQNSWWDTLKQWSPITNLYMWAQRNRRKATFLGSLATATLFTACYYGIKQYCQTSASTPTEEKPPTETSNASSSDTTAPITTPQLTAQPITTTDLTALSSVDTVPAHPAAEPSICTPEVLKHKPTQEIQSITTTGKEQKKEPQKPADEIWGTYKTEEFYDTQEQLKNEILSTHNTYPQLFKYFQDDSSEPDIQLIFDVYTLLKQKNLIDDNDRDSQIRYDIYQKMFYFHNTTEGRTRTVPAWEFSYKQLDLQKRGTQISQAEKDTFTHNYKIHLMPKKNELVPVILTVVKLLKTNSTFSDVIKVAKLYPNYLLEYDTLASKSNPEIIPAIVLYTFANSARTQLALDILFESFKNKHFTGNGIRPRFNAQVTDLIYFAQGNGDDKKTEQYRKTNLFEMPNMIYYDNKAVGEPEKSYHLKYPGTDIEITQPTKPDDVILK